MTAGEAREAAESWSDSLLVWNGVVASVPALVVRPDSAQELGEAAVFARNHGLRLAIARGRSESPTRALAERCLTLDLSSPP